MSLPAWASLDFLTSVVLRGWLLAGASSGGSQPGDSSAGWGEGEAGPRGLPSGSSTAKRACLIASPGLQGFLLAKPDLQWGFKKEGGLATLATIQALQGLYCIPWQHSRGLTLS